MSAAAQQKSAAAPAIDVERSDARLLSYVEFAMMTALDLTADQAREQAEKTTQALRAVAGGQSIYIPAPDMKLRNQAIRAQWTGNNLVALAHQYGLSTKQVARIISA